MSAMEVSGFLADSVVVADGKLFAQGVGWDRITTVRVPTVHDRIGVGLLIRVPYTATGQTHTWMIHLEDADGAVLPIGDAPDPAQTPDGKIRRIGSNFALGRPSDLQPGDDQIVPLAINVNSLRFEAEGAYRFVVTLDGTPTATLPFRVVMQRAAGPILG